MRKHVRVSWRSFFAPPQLSLRYLLSSFLFRFSDREKEINMNADKENADMDADVSVVRCGVCVYVRASFLCHRFNKPLTW